jgi:GNAT superfamily N-acetyltransferase
MDSQPISKIQNESDVDFVFPNPISFFEPHLRYYVKETLEIGGEAYVSKDSDGAIAGIFIYDDSERTGTIFTSSREVFERFYRLKSFESIFAELRTDHEYEPYDIYTLDLGDHSIAHRFKHEISVEEDRDIGEIEQFMVSTHHGLNRRWVNVALKDGDKCFTVRLGDEIAGMGWLSIVNSIGRLHSLFVQPQFRRIGIGEDIVNARLFWLKAKNAHSAFSEISRDNRSSSRIAMKAGMRPTGQIYQYAKKDSYGKTGLRLANQPRF